MKKVILTFSLLTAGLMATTDFSQMTTSELIELRGKVAIEDREAFRAEMRSRVATMSTEERNAFIASRQANRGMGGNGRVQGVNAQTFASIDTDGDGKITQAELDTARANRIKANTDAGKLLQNVSNAPTLSNIDTNGDGAIDANEFQAHQTAQMAQRQGMRRGRQVKTQRVGGGHSRP
jgi:hypothetical protein